METKTNISTSEILELLAPWKSISVEDMDSLRLYQKIDRSLGAFVELLEQLKSGKNDSMTQYLCFEWSPMLRDFSILLRDSLLASVKDEQFKKDNRVIEGSYINEILTIIRKAASEMSDDLIVGSDSKSDSNLWQHQASPLVEIQNQLKELQKQSKKIYRSSTKIDDIRFNINDYVKDFQLQFARQTSAVKQLFTIVDDVKLLVGNINNESSKTRISTVVDEISDKSQELELVKGIESIDILPYASNETLNLPVSTAAGNLNYKSINIKSELARWFSSFIYPKVVELESKRDHAVEKCMVAFSQIRAKIAAISLSDLDGTTDIQKDFNSIFSLLDKEVMGALKHEEEEVNLLVSSHLDKYLIASNIYANEMLFLPESGSSQIKNISKDAQKRLVSYYEKYKAELKRYTNKVLSRYFEIDKTPYGQYVRNLVSIQDEDDSLVLFLKKGYLGKSFTVPRPEVIDPIVEDYKLWLDGFAGAVLISGMTGSGKSTTLGMINHLGLNNEIIQLNYGESYFVKHRSYESKSNLKALIDEVIHQTRGRQIVLCIDDLELWHNEDIELFDNISGLFEALVQYRKKVFFVVTCTPFLKERLMLFKDIETIFSLQTSLERMNSNQIKDALNLRARVNNEMKLDELDLDSRFGHILRESRGNIGLAMMEYCRFSREDYKPNMKSQEFKELIKSYHTLLIYISSYHHFSLKLLLNTLSDMDYRETIESVDHLVGQKILIRPKNGCVAINPLLVHHVERTLLKITS